jgi:hypothetical protein
MDQESGQKPSVRIRLEPPFQFSGPMGTAIVSRVPSYSVQRDDWEKAVFCSVSRLARHLAECGMTEGAIREAVAKAGALESPGDSIEIDIR